MLVGFNRMKPALPKAADGVETTDGLKTQGKPYPGSNKGTRRAVGGGTEGRNGIGDQILYLRKE
jgi:hypothetical protein